MKSSRNVLKDVRNIGSGAFEVEGNRGGEAGVRYSSFLIISGAQLFPIKLLTQLLTVREHLGCTVTFTVRVYSYTIIISVRERSGCL